MRAEQEVYILKEKCITTILRPFGNQRLSLRGPASGLSSRTDSVVANHRVAEVARPLPLPSQRLGEASGDFSGAGDCGVAGRPRRGEERRCSGPLNELPK